MRLSVPTQGQISLGHRNRLFLGTLLQSRVGRCCVVLQESFSCRRLEIQADELLSVHALAKAACPAMAQILQTRLCVVMSFSSTWTVQELEGRSLRPIPVLTPATVLEAQYQCMQEVS